jgi:VWFA-related protein
MLVGSKRFLLTLAFLFLSAGAWCQNDGVPNSGKPDNSLSSASSASDTSSTSTKPLSSADLQEKLKFRSQSILVQVPVIVNDKHGSHVHGLTKNEIHVLENGKEQAIRVFEEKFAVEGDFPVAPSHAGEFHNLVLSDQQPRTVTVIALDTVNTPYLDQVIGRQQLLKYLAESLDSSKATALMVMTSHGLEVVQGLTGDTMHLVEALKKVSSEPEAMYGVSPETQADAAESNLSLPDAFTPGALSQFIRYGDAEVGRIKQEEAIETTLNSLMEVAWALSGVPGRKSLIWATGGFPFELTTPTSLPAGSLGFLYQRTIDALAEAQVSVYPVDVRGLTSADSGIGPHVGAWSQAERTRVAWLQATTLDTMDDFADLTGGKAFYNTSDLATSFKRAADDSSSYYLVGYYLNMQNKNPGWREIKVKVDRKDVQVRARKGFYATNGSIKMEEVRRTDLRYALTSPIEGTGVPVSVQWLGQSNDKGATRKEAFLVRLPVDGLSPDPAGPNKFNFDVAAAVYPANSKAVKPTATLAKTFTPSLSDAQLASVRASGIGFNDAFDLAPGAYAVRFVVRDNVTGKIGSVTAPLTVN